MSINSLLPDCGLNIISDRTKAVSDCAFNVEMKPIKVKANKMFFTIKPVSLNGNSDES